MTITVSGTNEVPTLSGQQSVMAAGTEDVAYTIHAADLLAGFSDVDANDPMAVLNLQAEHGSLTAYPDGLNWVFSPDSDYNGPVVLHYDVIDGNGGIAASQTFTLAAVNDTPNAEADINAGLEDTEITGTVATNDSDVDDGAIFTYALNAPVAGLTINQDGTYKFDATHEAYQCLAAGARWTWWPTTRSWTNTARLRPRR